MNGYECESLMCNQRAETECSDCDKKLCLDHSYFKNGKTVCWDCLKGY